MQILQSLSTVHHLTNVILHDVNYLINLGLQPAPNSVGNQNTSSFIFIWRLYLLPIADLITQYTLSVYPSQIGL